MNLDLAARDGTAPWGGVVGCGWFRGSLENSVFDLLWSSF